jgi:hypothetical protein
MVKNCFHEINGTRHLSQMADKLNSRMDCNSDCRRMGRTLAAWVTSGTVILGQWQNIICM